MPLDDKLGICQWFHYNDYGLLEKSIPLLHDLGVKNLHTGISWADYFRPQGKRWHTRLLQTLKMEGFDILASIWHTPPSISESGTSHSPPRDLKEYADFVDQVITCHGDCIDTIGIWNEPNCTYFWNQGEDPGWRKFARMAVLAGNWARQRGKRTVLGGMAQLDMYWLGYMLDNDVFPHVDIVGSHGFPFMWEPHATGWDFESHWYGFEPVPPEEQGWPYRIRKIEEMSGKPVWITETGLATYDKASGQVTRHGLQCRILEQAAAAPCERVYWYTLLDLDPQRAAIEELHGTRREEAEYHLGLVTHAGERKPAYWTMKRLLQVRDPRTMPLRQTASRDL